MKKAKAIFSAAMAPLATASLGVLILFLLGIWICFRRNLNVAAMLGVGIYWLYQNRARIGWKLQKLRIRLLSLRYGYLDHSFWFENEGRARIKQLLEELSETGHCYCNLVEQIDLPGEEHWMAISKGLNDMGVLCQCTKDAFYVTWNPEAFTMQEAAA